MLLARLKAGGHKCLIFTQMSKMLDVLEVSTCREHRPNLHPVPYADGLRCMELNSLPSLSSCIPRHSSTYTPTHMCGWMALPSQSSARS